MTTLSHPNDSIGVFDSGLGGLTVLNALRKQLPQENFIYLADTARIPYGNKTENTLIRIGEKCCRFLEQKQVKLIVIACHTVSSVAFLTLKSSFRTPLIGMVEPSLEQIKLLKNPQKLVLLGTRRTIDAGTYEKMLLGEEAISSITSLPCPLFVSLVEEGHVADHMSDLVVEKTLSSLKDLNPTSVFLGCTHFPFLRASIEKSFPSTLILDPAEYVATAVESTLKLNKMENPSTQVGTIRYFATDDPSRFSVCKSRLLVTDVEPAQMAILS